MEITPAIIILIIAVFSVVQSLFGVGLLVFGTPTFLLLGASYAESVGYLLPSSLLLSSIQAHGFRDKIRIARGVVLYAMPFVFFGLLLSIDVVQHSFILAIVGATMLLLSLMRIIGVEKISKEIIKFDRSFLVITGFIHGISNQGGALLTVLMGSIYSDKEKVRTNIAFAYLLFGLSQLVVLLWLKVDVISWMSIVYGLVTVLLYQLVGKSLFQSINMNTFDLIFTGFMIIYGILLLTPVTLNYMEIL
ncbi:TSUP family transporter [bacterium]|jgi:hypothetical protein|nr:TSUP family transporter [bacterium]